MRLVCLALLIGCAPLETNVDPGIVVKTASISELTQINVVGLQYATGTLTVIDDTDTARDHDVVISSHMHAQGITTSDASTATFSFDDVVTTPDLFGTFKCARAGMALFVGAALTLCENDAGVRLSMHGVHKGFDIDMLDFGELTIGSPDTE
jgi:hypothetical protein